MIYYIDGLGGPIASAGTHECMGAIWNPSGGGNRQIRVVSMSLFMRDWDVPPNVLYMAKISARGTPGSTITPDADNAEDGATPPVQAWVLDLAEYTVQPTQTAVRTHSGMTFPPAGATADTGSGFTLPLPRGFVLKPGSGLGIFEVLASTFGGTWDINCVVSD